MVSATMSFTIPATQPSNLQNTSKRKRPESSKDDILAKKQRFMQEDATPVSTLSSSLTPLESLLSELRPKYEVKTMSVITSTSICKHIDKALAHLSRFSFLDASVLPGVIVLYTKSKAASKAVTVAETIRRRISEGGQKWYQYNVLYEIALHAQTARESSIVEETLLSDDETSPESFGLLHTGATRASLWDLAVDAPKSQSQAVMAVFISRVPVAELLPFCNTGVQTNASEIDRRRKDQLGLP